MKFQKRWWTINSKWIWRILIGVINMPIIFNCVSGNSEGVFIGLTMNFNNKMPCTIKSKLITTPKITKILQIISTITIKNKQITRIIIITIIHHSDWLRKINMINRYLIKFINKIVFCLIFLFDLFMMSFLWDCAFVGICFDVVDVWLGFGLLGILLYIFCFFVYLGSCLVMWKWKIDMSSLWSYNLDL